MSDASEPTATPVGPDPHEEFPVGFFTRVDETPDTEFYDSDRFVTHIDDRAIRKLAQRGDMAILLVEQYYDFARDLADRYVVLNRGVVVKSGPGDEMERENVRALLAV